MILIKKCIKFSFLGLIIILITSGCSISVGGDSVGQKADGGVFRSVNKGDTWLQTTNIPTVSGQPKSFGMLDANLLIMDPSDNNALYFGSVDNGLFYSYDGANTWRSAYSLDKATIRSIAVDPEYKCTIYVAVANKLYKSNDCSRNWAQVYFDNDLTVGINSIAIDSINSAIIYIGTSRGDVIRSLDRGNSWQTIKQFNGQIAKIIVSQINSKLIFVGINNKEVFRSIDSGKTWVDLSDKLKESGYDSDFRDLIIAGADKKTLFLITNNGLFSSADDGNSWKKIKLITPEDGAIINSIAVGVKKINEIYYATNTTFYRSIDGGQNWTTKKLPTSRAGWKLLTDPKNENLIYLAARQVKKK